MVGLRSMMKLTTNDEHQHLFYFNFLQHFPSSNGLEEGTSTTTRSCCFSKLSTFIEQKKYISSLSPSFLFPLFLISFLTDIIRTMRGNRRRWRRHSHSRIECCTYIKSIFHTGITFTNTVSEMLSTINIVPQLTQREHFRFGSHTSWSLLTLLVKT